MSLYEQEVIQKLRLGQIDLDIELSTARAQLRATNCPTLREAYNKTINFLANLQGNEVNIKNIKIFLN